jgi:hypothetical protein
MLCTDQLHSFERIKLIMSRFAHQITVLLLPSSLTTAAAISTTGRAQGKHAIEMHGQPFYPLVPFDLWGAKSVE